MPNLGPSHSVVPLATPLARRRVAKLLACLTTALLLSKSTSAQDVSAQDFGAAPDPHKVISHEACAKCHDAEIKQWLRTPHYRTFDLLHRTDEAKQIAKRLGMRSVKRNDTCVRCHYTQQTQRERLRIVAGVSCESCHGAAKDWVDLHADYGSFGATKETETAEHRAERRRQSIDAGMNNPSNLYLIARQCLSCHTTPSESLVNVGGHQPGSADFELVSWSQGSVRHNFLRGGGTTNAPSSLPRVRVMYLVGQLADLEASLRAVAAATSAEKFGIASATRAANVKQRLWEAQRLLDDPLLGKALEAVSKVELKLDNSAAIKQAADEVGAIASRFATDADGDELAAIDKLLPAPSSYK